MVLKKSFGFHVRLEDIQMHGKRDKLLQEMKVKTWQVIRGFWIRQDTVAHLGPVEQVWASRLIAQGVWQLVLDDEA